MTKFLIPLAAALVLTVGPALADDSETRIEERVEKSDGFDTRSATRSVEIERDNDDESKTVEREEKIETDDGTVERSVEERVEHSDD